MSKHTTGPWVVIGDCQTRTRIVWVGDDEESTEVATVSVGTYSAPSSLGEKRANARLIAAAPDLLEACKAVLAHQDVSNPDEDTEMVVKCLRAAIAKAEGKP